MLHDRLKPLNPTRQRLTGRLVRPEALIELELNPRHSAVGPRVGAHAVPTDEGRVKPYLTGRGGMGTAVRRRDLKQPVR
jgi:hypothetical protein